MNAAHDRAIQAVFLSNGFFEAQLAQPEPSAELHSGIHGGQIGIVADLCSYADFIEDVLEKYTVIEDWPGVFQYEVSESLGAWLYEHPDEFTNDGVGSAFKEHATKAIEEWFK
jgi:hypothetical protein